MTRSTKARCLAAIGMLVAAKRRCYLPEIFGQETTFRRVDEQARAFVASGPPAGAWLAAVAQARGVSNAAAATAIVAASNAWDGDAGPAIEKARIVATIAANDLEHSPTDEADAATVLDTLRASLLSIR